MLVIVKVKVDTLQAELEENAASSERARSLDHPLRHLNRRRRQQKKKQQRRTRSDRRRCRPRPKKANSLLLPLPRHHPKNSAPSSSTSPRPPQESRTGSGSKRSAGGTTKPWRRRGGKGRTLRSLRRGLSRRQTTLARPSTKATARLSPPLLLLRSVFRRATSLSSAGGTRPEPTDGTASGPRSSPLLRLLTRRPI